MGRFTHKTSGVRVNVADGKVLGPDWASLDAPERSEVPDKSWKVADLKAHAEENGINLGEATKKDDILAAIDAADESDDDESDDSDESDEK